MSSTVHILYNTAQFGFCYSQLKKLTAEKSVDEAKTAKSYTNTNVIEKNSKIFDLFLTIKTKKIYRCATVSSNKVVTW